MRLGSSRWIGIGLSCNDDDAETDGSHSRSDDIGTITGSAKLLNVPAPGIGRLVKYTERSLGVRFFTRQNGCYDLMQDTQLIFEQINAI